MSPFADNVGREIRSFAFNPSPITRMFASPADYVREPLQLANGNFYLFDGLDANSLLLNMYMPELKRIRDTAAAGDLDRLCAHTSTSIASRS